ncbi:hypothetical protein BDZ94DRAFT_1253988 [Collybia nuda]|uniref:Uncharacterized protein n=1 Tax=Collybia nuda TaxID=64659 RepID=A0A9P5YB68_9AGAR|nr:hypothetical protein BDZ94DRAFT_1253988 [Collybia nuda]
MLNRSPYSPDTSAWPFRYITRSNIVRSTRRISLIITRPFSILSNSIISFIIFFRKIPTRRKPTSESAS